MHCYERHWPKLLTEVSIHCYKRNWPKLLTDVSMHCYERNWQTVGVKVWNSMHLAKSSNICTTPCEIQFSIYFIIFYVVNFGWIFSSLRIYCSKHSWAKFSCGPSVLRNSLKRVGWPPVARRQDEKCGGWGFPLGIPRAKGREMTPPPHLRSFPKIHQIWSRNTPLIYMIYIWYKRWLVITYRSASRRTATSNELLQIWWTS